MLPILSQTSNGFSRIATKRLGQFLVLVFCCFLGINDLHSQAKKSPENNNTQTLVIFKENDLFGYRTHSGKVVIPPRFSWAYQFSSEGIAAVMIEDNYWSYIDTRGHELLRPFIFDNGPDYFRRSNPNSCDSSGTPTV